MAAQSAFCGTRKSVGTLGIGTSIVGALLSHSTMIMNTDALTKRNFGRSLESSLTIMEMFLPDGSLGHREFNPKTTCPSEFFLGGNGKGWKSDLLIAFEGS